MLGINSHLVETSIPTTHLLQNTSPNRHVRTILKHATETQSASSARTNLINKLPVETLAIIFELYVEEEKNTASALRRPFGALPLGAVCSEWRRIAWTCTRLWSSLTFWLREETTEVQIELAVEWLGRSGEQPLSITLHGLNYGEEEYTDDGSDDSDDWHDSDSELEYDDDDVENYVDEDEDEDEEEMNNNSVLLLAPLIMVISRSLDRCYRLKLSHLPYESYSQLTRGSKEATALQHLEVNAPGLELPLDFVRSASPNFLDVLFTKVDLFVMNWDNLTELVVREWSFCDVIKALSLALHLVTCRMIEIYVSDEDDAFEVGADDPESRDRTVCDEIKRLDIRNSSCKHVFPVFLRFLECPKLTSLSMSCNDTFVAADLLVFLRQSKCTLTELFIPEGTVSGEDMVCIIGSLPSLTSLVISACARAYTPSSVFAAPFLLQMLCWDAQPRAQADLGQTLPPQLEHITLDIFYPLPWSLIVGLRYASRYAADGRRVGVQMRRTELKSITIVYHDYISPRSGLDSTILSDSEDEDEDDTAAAVHLQGLAPPCVPDYLIQDWDTFSELVKLSNEVRLELWIRRVDEWMEHLFFVSYKMLRHVYGRAPADVRDFMRKGSWIAKIDTTR